MSPEDRKVFDDYFDLFQHPAWKHLVNDLEESLKQIDTLRGVADAKALWTNQGKIEVIERVVALKQYTQNLYDSILEDEHDEVV